MWEKNELVAKSLQLAQCRRKYLRPISLYDVMKDGGIHPARVQDDVQEMANTPSFLLAGVLAPFCARAVLLSSQKVILVLAEFLHLEYKSRVIDTRSRRRSLGSVFLQ